MAASGGAFPDADMGFGAAHLSINSPYALARLIVTLTAFAMIVVAAIMGRAVQEDIEYRTASFFASGAISKADYLLGRFLGAYGVVALILAAAPLGAWCATFLPGHRSRHGSRPTSGTPMCAPICCWRCPTGW